MISFYVMSMNDNGYPCGSHGSLTLYEAVAYKKYREETLAERKYREILSEDYYEIWTKEQFDSFHDPRLPLPGMARCVAIESVHDDVNYFDKKMVEFFVDSEGCFIACSQEIKFHPVTGEPIKTLPSLADD